MLASIEAAHRVLLFLKFNASKMQASTTQKTKDSAGRRLGVKKFGQQEVFPGDILVRQRGMKFKCGTNTVGGKDHTITSLSEGVVVFQRSLWRKNHYSHVNVVHGKIPNRLFIPMKPYNYHPELFPERAAKNVAGWSQQLHNSVPIPK